MNASPLIFLTRVGLLEVLRETADEVWIPTAVIDEIARKGPGDSAAAALLTNTWLQPVSSSPTSDAFSAWNLGLGETAVLELAHSLPGSVAVLDDRAARRLARDRGIPILGTLALVAAAKGIGLIPRSGPLSISFGDPGCISRIA